MNTHKRYLEQAGLVTDTRNGKLTISLIGSGCTGCHDSLCMLGKSSATRLQVPGAGTSFRAGDEVIVRISPAHGYKAVLLLYVLPFLLIVVDLLVLLQLGFHELTAGIASLLVLLPYFSMVYGFRNRLQRACHFDVMRR